MYIVEGNNGVGKSTLLRLIKKHLSHLEVTQEPVNAWATQGDQDQSLLEKFYTDSPRWAYTMETYTMLTRVQEHVRVQNMPHPFKIMERSLYSGHYCFARNGYEQAFMDDTEWNIYNKWFEFLVPQKCHPPIGLIYLQSDPQVCYDRGVKRNRPGEEAVPLEYFQQLHEQHENYLIKKQGILNELKEVPVLVLDGNHEFENDPEVYNEYFEKIEEFLLFTHPINKNKEVQKSI